MFGLQRALNLIFRPLKWEVRTTRHLRPPDRLLAPSTLELNEIEEDEVDFVMQCFSEGLTPTSFARAFSLIRAMKRIFQDRVPGDFVEVGVWRGAYPLIMKYIINKNKEDRSVWLFDTFEGMTMPRQDEVDSDLQSAQARWLRSRRPGGSDWWYASIDEVKQNFDKRALLDDRVYFIKSDVSELEPTGNRLPESVALLRFDASLYSPTIRAYELFWPLVSSGGFVVHNSAPLMGAEMARRDFFKERSDLPFFHSVDPHVLMAQKC